MTATRTASTWPSSRRPSVRLASPLLPSADSQLPLTSISHPDFFERIRLINWIRATVRLSRALHSPRTRADPAACAPSPRPAEARPGVAPPPRPQRRLPRRRPVPQARHRGRCAPPCVVIALPTTRDARLTYLAARPQSSTSTRCLSPPPTPRRPPLQVVSHPPSLPHPLPRALRSTPRRRISSMPSARSSPTPRPPTTSCARLSAPVSGASWASMRLRTRRTSRRW